MGQMGKRTNLVWRCREQVLKIEEDVDGSPEKQIKLKL